MHIEWSVESKDQKYKYQGNCDWQQGAVHIHVPTESIILGNVEARINVMIGHDEKIFMNGYQTWTKSPELSSREYTRGLRKLPRKIVEKYSFDRYGDYHFVDYPEKRGITHGESWCYFRKGNHFRLFSSLDEDAGYTFFQYNAKIGELTIRRDCIGVRSAGILHAFDLFYCEGSEKEVFDAWFAALQIKPLTKQKLYGYSSWYNHYQNIDADQLHKDLTGCTRVFADNDLFQIDDGWEPFVGDWLIADENKFPAGLGPIVQEIHQKGFRAGLWLAPFVAEEKSALFHDHPEWFFRVDGKPWKLGCNWSGFYSLDIDLPEVIEYLRTVFQKVFEEWDFDLVKLDFLYGAAPFGNETESRARRMKRAMELLRDFAKEKQILACGVPLMPTFGLVEYSRIGCDVSLDWDDVFYMRFFHRERVSTKNAIVNIVSRRELNGRAFMNDPDVFFIRKKNIKLSEHQKYSLAQLQTLLGGVFLTSDNPADYDEEMVEKYRYYRNLSRAVVLDISLDHGIDIVYQLDDHQHTVHLFKTR